MIIRLASNESECDEVLRHLRAADTEFIPPLSQRVDLQDYASKLCGLAEREEAWCDAELVALVATYCNDRERGAYISNVSVLPAYRRQGLANLLIARALKRVRERYLPMITLHLHPDNQAALALYLRHGFILGATEGNQLTMFMHLDRP